MALFAEGEAGAAVGMSIALIVFLCVLAILFEMTPTWIALLRGHPNWMPIAIINFFFSWTIIGWIVCLAWSFSSIHTPDTNTIIIAPRRRRRRDDDED